MIFLSYVSEDRDRVLPYYDLLHENGLDPWMDCRSIVAGQNWDYEIKTSLERAELIIIFISENSVDKRGYAQREIKIAIDKYEEKISGDIYIIPVLLDPTDFPHHLRGIHFLKSFEVDAQQELLRSIAAASNRAKENIENTQSKSEIRWHKAESKSDYSGIPGYSTTISKISLSSAKYGNISDISDHINGILSRYAMSARGAVLSPDASLYNRMQDHWKRTDTFDAIFHKASVRGRVFSAVYSLHWYNAGAMHPTHSPQTFNYLLDPVYLLEKPEELFSSDSALAAIKKLTRDRLETALSDGASNVADKKLIFSGTDSWDSFSNFSFDDEGMTFQFSSYQVACYAAGMPSVHINYSDLVEHFSDNVLYALDLHRP